MTPGIRIDELLSESRALQSRLAGSALLAEDPTATLLEKLLRSEERLRLPTQSGKFGVWDFDVASSEVFWTDSLYAIHGVDPDTFPCTLESFSSLVHPDDRARVQESVRRALEQDMPYELEFRAVRPDGEIIWLFTSATVLREEHGPVRMLGLTVDVTHRKRAELATAESEAAYRNLVKSLPAAVYTCDPSGRVLLFNDAAAGLWGREPEVGRDFWRGSYRMEYPDGRAMRIDECPMAVALREKRAVRGQEIIIVRPDGTRRNVLPHPEPLYDTQGNLTGMLNMLVDITVFRETEAALADARGDLAWQVDALTQLHGLAERASRSQDLQALMNTTLETIVSITGADMGLLSLYDAGTDHLRPVAISGFSAAALEMLNGLVPTENAGACGCAFATRNRVIVEDAATHPLFGDFQPLVREAGFRSVFSTPILTRHGEILGVLSVHYRQRREPQQRELQMTDVCARQAADALEALRARQALHESNDHLERRVQERTKQLRSLALALSDTEERERKRLARELHDNIQQMLVAIKMQASLAEMRPEGGGSLREVIKLSEEAIAACRALVIGLSPPVLQDADLRSGLSWVARRVKEQHGLDVELVVQEPLQPVSQSARTLLFEIARELLFNVVKHAGVQEAKVVLRCEQGRTCIEVVDAGKGCDLDLLEQNQQESFGLYSIRERLALLGGTMEASSSPAKGTRVVVSVPNREGTVAGDTDADGTQPRTETAKSAESTLRVLLADDHVMLRQGLAQMLSSQPDMHVIAQASNGLEALELARKLQPDFVLMDITMPVLSGIDATRRIASELPHVRVVGLSMHDSEEMAAAMQEAGAIAFVNKAEAMDKLLTILRNAI